MIGSISKGCVAKRRWARDLIQLHNWKLWYDDLWIETTYIFSLLTSFIQRVSHLSAGILSPWHAGERCRANVLILSDRWRKWVSGKLPDLSKATQVHGGATVELRCLDSTLKKSHRISRKWTLTKRKAVPDIRQLAWWMSQALVLLGADLTLKLGHGVLLVNMDNFTKQQHRTRSLHDWNGSISILFTALALLSRRVPCKYHRYLINNCSKTGFQSTYL